MFGVRLSCHRRCPWLASFSARFTAWAILPMKAWGRTTLHWVAVTKSSIDLSLPVCQIYCESWDFDAVLKSMIAWPEVGVLRCIGECALQQPTQEVANLGSHLILFLNGSLHPIHGDEETQLFWLEASQYEALHQLLVDLESEDHGHQCALRSASVHFLALHPIFLFGFLLEQGVGLFFRRALQCPIFVFAGAWANTIQIQPPDVTGQHLVPVILGCHHDSLVVVVLVHPNAWPWRSRHCQKAGLLLRTNHCC